MNINEFIEGYNAARDKGNYVDKHIKTKYLGYGEKMSVAKNIARISSHIIDENGNVGEYKRDTMAQYFHTQMNIITNYTDIDVPAEEVVNIYDMLCESGAIKDILAKLETECAILKSMVQMAMDDTYVNEWDISAVLGTKLDALRILADTTLSAIQSASEKAIVEEQE